MTDITGPEGPPLGFLPKERLELLLRTAKTETDSQAMVRNCITRVFEDLDPITSIKVAGELIEYGRELLAGLASIRRTATVTARITMTPDEIAKAAGLSRQTVARLVTEHREP